MTRFLLLLLVTSFLAACGGGGGGSSTSQSGEEVFNNTRSAHIKVDQLGYTRAGKKTAIISNPVSGFNQADTYTPGDTFELRSADDDSVIYSADITSFNNGATDTQSGDQIWYFDFSSVTASGEYYVYDPDNETSSDVFDIADDVYADALEQAVRTFYYQRAGMAKTARYAGSDWADGASHTGTEQDTDCRLMDSSDPTTGDATTSKDLSGGWYDAGDFNKYVNFADGALHNLLFAYQENPAAFTDDYNIPESGNGTPDIIDEIKYELDWLLKMQIADGSVLHKVSSISWDGTTPPSTDTVKRRYAPATASATISFAGVCAHSAIVFATIDAAYAATLQTAADNAWSWLEANSGSIPSTFDNAGFVNADAEDSSDDQDKNMLAAAIYLLMLTDDAKYQTYIDNNSSDALLLDANGWMTYDNVDEELQNALLYYTTYSGADATLSADIINNYNDKLESPFNDFAPIYAYENNLDGYLGYIDTYYWGSSRAKAQAGSTVYNIAQYSVKSGDTSEYEELASDYLHYFHGANPLNIVYLSNMNAHGAVESVDEFYHMWFTDGSNWDNVNDSFGPPPGFLAGGANENYDVAGVYIDDVVSAIYLLKNQPAAKAFMAWNDVNDESYRVTENSITYQAAYIRLLSKFVD